MVAAEAHVAEAEVEAEGTVEADPEVVAVGVLVERQRDELEGGEDLSHPDRGDGEDEPGCPAEPADDGELDEQADADRGQQAGGDGEDVRHPEALVELGGQGRRHRPQLALGEVDDPVRPVDEDQADGEQRVEQADDDGPHVEAVRHDHGALHHREDDLAEDHDRDEPGGGEDRRGRHPPQRQLIPPSSVSGLLPSLGCPQMVPPVDQAVNSGGTLSPAVSDVTIVTKVVRARIWGGLSA